MIELPTNTPLAQQQYNRLLTLPKHTFAFEVVENYAHGYFNKEQAAHLIEHYITQTMNEQQSTIVASDTQARINFIEPSV